MPPQVLQAPLLKIELRKVSPQSCPLQSRLYRMYRDAVEVKFKMTITTWLIKNQPRGLGRKLGSHVDHFVIFSAHLKWFISLFILTVTAIFVQPDESKHNCNFTILQPVILLVGTSGLSCLFFLFPWLIYRLRKDEINIMTLKYCIQQSEKT